MSIGALTQTQFDALTPIVHDDLVPITSANTTVDLSEAGWRVDLSIGGWNGEKVLSEARTFANQVFFSTFQPSTAAMTCQPQLGTNRTYVMNVYNGAPVMNLDAAGDPDALTMDDLFVEAEGGILPAAEALFLDQDSNGDGIPDIEDDEDGDGLSDAADGDDDGDGVADEMEDFDGDGEPNITDGDDDGDGMPDNIDNNDLRANGNEDQDGDGIPNYLDPDMDGDGVLNQDDDDDDVVFVGRVGYTGVMSNNPVRTFWSQEQTRLRESRPGLAPGRARRHGNEHMDDRDRAASPHDGRHPARAHDGSHGDWDSRRDCDPELPPVHDACAAGRS